MNNLEFYHQKRWGNDRYYPNSALARALCELMKQKSLTKVQLEVFARYGLEVSIEFEINTPVQNKINPSSPI